MNIEFSSRAFRKCKPALEELMFFNPRQGRVRDGIVNSLEKFGRLELVEDGDALSVRVGDHETQTLFAYDTAKKGGDPVGVIVFLRTSPAEIAIMHVAVHPNYALQGRRAGAGLGVTLVEKVKEIGARIAGVTKIVFFYRNEVVIHL